MGGIGDHADGSEPKKKRRRAKKFPPGTCNPLGWCGGEGLESCPIHSDPPTLGDERAFLVVLHEIVNAAISVLHRAHDPGRGGMYCAHPWLRVREEVYARLQSEGGGPQGMFGFSRFRRENETILHNIYRAYEIEIGEGKRKKR